METTLALLALIAVIFFVAGIVKGITGMGLPTVAMGLLGSLVSPLAAAALLVMPSLITNLWQLVAGPSFVPVTLRLWPMMLAITVATIAGTAFIANGRSSGPTAALGAVLMLYAIYTLLARPLSVSARLERWLSPAIGLVTGMITGATGIFVVPAVPYLQSLGLSRDDLIQALGLSFTVSTIALAGGLAWHGEYHASALMTSAIAIIPALAGMAAGQAIRARIDPGTFRKWFLICLFALGLEMLLRAFL
ncbi:sulfite exporter TauE/SafE family protein [Rhizobium sp. LjRoot258]|uniref:sulfite exporter TauE/SafE family protein n=1 Tax=Rhizobium sp. LjRoot258 TaxID=3342299 RepID=UPI003ED0E0B4